MNVIYQTAAGERTEFEFEYIDRVLFGGVEHSNFFDNANYQLVKDSPVVVFSNDSRNIEPAFRGYLEKLSNYTLLHLSNECLRHRGSHSYRGARVVFRSCCYDPNLPLPNVFTLPLGFKSGVYNDRKESLSTDREYAWSFLGQIKGQRCDMIKIMASIKPSMNHFTSGFNSADGKTPPELITIYQNTIFVPCPKGNVIPECNRTMECLEHGCIPVVVRFKGLDYYKYVYGDHPFIIDDTWEECAEQMKALLADSKRLRDRQAEVMEWYRGFCEELRADVAAILADGTDAVVKSKQFEYQRVRLEWSQRLQFLRAFKL